MVEKRQRRHHRTTNAAEGLALLPGGQQLFFRPHDRWCRFAQPPATSFDASGIILLRDVSFLTATSLHSGRAHGKIIFGPGTGGPDQLPARLFHLEDDLGEKTDVANANPEKVVELIRLMERLIARGQTTSGPDHQNDASFEATSTSQKQGQGKVPPVSCSGQIRLINQISRARQGLLSA